MQKADGGTERALFPSADSTTDGDEQKRIKEQQTGRVESYCDHSESRGMPMIWCVAARDADICSQVAHTILKRVVA